MLTIKGNEEILPWLLPSQMKGKGVNIASHFYHDKWQVSI